MILTHRVDGGGPPLVLLNGGMMSFSGWDLIAAELAERFSVVRCDFSGQLRSPGPAHTSLEPHAEDVAALLDHLGIAQAAVVGTSFGAQVGLVLAARHPERVSALVAATAAERATPEFVHGAQALREASLIAARTGDPSRLAVLLSPLFYSEAFVRDHGAEMARRSEGLWAMPAAWFEGVAGLLEALETMDLRPLLGRIACPTLVIAAEQDLVFPPERGRALAEAIAGARFEAVPASGHVLVVEHPTIFVSLVLGFLGEALVPAGQSKAEGRRANPRRLQRIGPGPRPSTLDVRSRSTSENQNDLSARGREGEQP
ncbi:MAG TPA: alpha/beta fold hydrolase [Thermoanaerobaculaceae bacterium]|nr:alpha/beta fold hydrolase [Thermoanaerobaculaceae bacterium]HRS16141.1 alpha/beta fold hydrolase [Thermoanaerobaculaceae bacterium]